MKKDIYELISFISFWFFVVGGFVVPGVMDVPIADKVYPLWPLFLIVCPIATVLFLYLAAKEDNTLSIVDIWEESPAICWSIVGVTALLICISALRQGMLELIALTALCLTLMERSQE